MKCRRPGFNPWLGKILWRRERLPTPVFWLEKFHELYSPWGRKESDTTEWLSNIHFSHLELVEAIATKTNSQSLLGKTTWLCKVSIVAILYIGKTEASSQYFKNSWQKHFKKKTFQNRFSNRWCFIWIRKTGSFSQRTKVSWSLESE